MKDMSDNELYGSEFSQPTDSGRVVWAIMAFIILIAGYMLFS